MGSAIEIGVLAWTGVFVIGFVLIRRSVYSILDPVALAGVFVPFAAALLAVLCGSGSVSWEKFGLFLSVLVGYGLGARLTAAFANRFDLRTGLLGVLASISRKEVDVLYLIALAVTAALGLLGLISGAAGDARQAFEKTFRPLVLIQGGLSLYAVLLLLSPYLSRRAACIRLILLLTLSVPFSGKSVLAPMLIWFGLLRFLYGRALTIRGVIGVTGLAVVAAALMATLAYGAHGIRGAFLLLATRVWLSGDTYIYAYQLHGLDALRGSYPVTFLAYMLHPITSLVGIRAYDRPLGSMLMSALSGTDALNGPNPHLPVLLDFFFPNEIGRCFLLALLIGTMVFALRPLGVAAMRGRGRYIRFGGAVVAIFCPVEGFLDTSQVLITLVEITAVTGFVTLLEFLTSPRLPVLPRGPSANTETP